MSVSVSTKGVTRKPAVAGLFYPGSRSKLREAVNELLNQTSGTVATSQVFGLIAPHAGYMYSGDVAAEAFSQLKGIEPGTIVILSPSHRDYFRGVSVYRGDYETPLGRIPMDQDFVDELLGLASVVFESDLGHREEHGIEVELPFLQTVVTDFQLVPLVMGTQDVETIETVGRALERMATEKKFLIVASSDLSHFHSQEEANKLDRQVIADVEAFDEKQLLSHIQSRKSEACGYGPIAVALKTVRSMGADRSSVLKYHTSGNVNGEFSEVVGYLSAVFY